MITTSRFAGLLLLGMLTCNLSCTGTHKNKTPAMTFMPGPVISGGVTYYPEKPGATYRNFPADYTTNLPPTDAFSFVTVFSTNGLVIRLLDGDTTPGTNGTAIHFIKAKLDARGNLSTNLSSPVSSLY